MLKNIINLFKSDITIVKHKNDTTLIMNKITKLYSRGNVNLRQGKYITSSSIKEKQKEIFPYTFSS